MWNVYWSRHFVRKSPYWCSVGLLFLMITHTALLTHWPVFSAFAARTSALHFAGGQTLLGACLCKRERFWTVHDERVPTGFFSAGPNQCPHKAQSRRRGYAVRFMQLLSLRTSGDWSVGVRRTAAFYERRTNPHEQHLLRPLHCPFSRSQRFSRSSTCTLCAKVCWDKGIDRLVYIGSFAYIRVNC